MPETRRPTQMVMRVEFVRGINGKPAPLLDMPPLLDLPASVVKLPPPRAS